MSTNQHQRPRTSEINIDIGILDKGDHNSITDVSEVKVGHVTLISGQGRLNEGHGPTRTGITVILPHSGNIYRQKVTASTFALNGFGKAVGFMQISELGTIESPIALTSTLNTWRVADYMIDYLHELNPEVHSFNPVVVECNDWFLNDGIGRHVNNNHFMEAINNSCSPNIEEGNVGAGTGMTAFGWKAGIGTSSRLCESPYSKYTVGVLALCNMGDPRDLRIGGVPIGNFIKPPGIYDESGGSIAIIIATDAPLTARQLNRMARRASVGLSKVGGMLSHASGSFSIAFSNSREKPNIDDSHMSILFRGVAEATEEAIVNSILRAETISGRDDNTRHAIPVDQILDIIDKHYRALKSL